jgi:hypothetical protein
MAWSGLNHHAVGAVPVSTPDGGMHFGMVRWVEAGYGKAWSRFYCKVIYGR